MANIKDPAFWHRFSLAVHLEEQASSPAPVSSEGSNGSVSGRSNKSRPTIQHTDTWLDRQHKKRRRALCICWSIGLLLLATGAAVGVVIWWLSRNGDSLF
ncbi:MAG: hypothetical protein M1817_003392 [Caeruleum heppii]|nr:MAG: hypothetical protein M1817_003392 [Caeruleum heppii]